MQMIIIIESLSASFLRHADCTDSFDTLSLSLTIRPYQSSLKGSPLDNIQYLHSADKY